MRLLFAITVCCFLAVMWVALALARRIRLAQLLQTRPGRKAASAYTKQEFFEAGEFRTPRPLRLEQEILQQRPRRPLSDIFSAPEKPVAAPRELSQDLSQVLSQELPQDLPRPRATEPIPIRRAAAFASLFGQTVPIARIDSHLRTAPLEALPPATDTAIANVAPRSVPVSFTLHRRPPQPARPSGLRRRIDLSQYNKDMGDLTDPYTHPLRGSGTQGPVPANHNDR